MKVLVFLALLQIATASDVVEFEENDVTKVEHIAFNHIYVEKPFELRNYKYSRRNISHEDVEPFISKIKLDLGDGIIKSIKLTVYCNDKLVEDMYKQNIDHGNRIVSINIEKIYLDPCYKLIFTFYIDVADLYKSTSYILTYHEQIAHHITHADIYKYGIIGGLAVMSVKGVFWIIAMILGFVAFFKLLVEWGSIVPTGRLM